MTKKINDIDVSEWELKGILIPIMECKYFEGIGDCKESKGLCVANENCYFKQLKRLQEENEELEKKNKELLNLANNGGALLVAESTKNKKYKQALEEIREKAQKHIKAEKICFANEIIDLIDEVLNDRD